MEQEVEAAAPVADVSASESTATAVVEDEAASQQPAVEADEAPKTFTQQELDDIVAKRLARLQRKWEREQQTRQPAPAPEAAPAAPLRLEQFESPEAYAEALAEQKAAERIHQQEVQRQQAEIAESHFEREEAARAKYDDYEQVAYNPRLPITTTMAEAIRASDIGPDLAYHLGQNPKEADRIAKLSPLLQAKEIGRLEAKLVDAPPVKKSSSAPAPISPVTPRSTSAAAIDTTDPRSIKTMSTSEWIEAENKRIRQKWEARNR